MADHVALLQPCQDASHPLAKGRNHLMTAAELPLRGTLTIHPIKRKAKSKITVTKLWAP